MTYAARDDRYDRMIYRRCGATGLKLPAISLGLWHNFGHDTPHATKRAICQTAFDHGITHFDLANNYGPPAGSAEEAFGDILKTDFRLHRDELIISSKAGYHMWNGPYGEWGSRKYLIASCDQSLKRMGLDMSISSIPTGSTPTPRLRKPWLRSITSCGLAARFMSGCPATIPSARARRR
jgi:L-glyceraldehyde 3-phosphate reductase